MPEPIITNCTRKTILQMSQWRSEGLSYQAIADLSGYHYNQTTRYLRVLEQYGIEAFKPDQQTAA